MGYYAADRAFEEMRLQQSLEMMRSAKPIEFDFSSLSGSLKNLTDMFKPSYEGEFTPNQILQSGDRTIVFWKDGTKTIVKRAADEEFNTYAAFTAALAIKIFGSNTHLKKVIDGKLKVQEKKAKKKVE